MRILCFLNNFYFKTLKFLIYNNKINAKQLE